MVERYQMHHSNDMPVHKFIPMEKLDLIQPNQVRILYYQNPSRFYVYLREKINNHAQFQVELQRAMQNYQLISSPPQYQRYQPVVAQDNHAIWHRATILDFNSDLSEICVYFVDVGQQENISLTNIRPLPQEFIRQPAFAIPCRLYQIYPLNSNDQSIWKSDDPVHDEFNRLMANNASCKVCDIKEQICYDVEIEIPKVGDLGTFLFEKNLVSHMNMRTSHNTNQSQQQSFGRIPPGFSAITSSIQPIQRLTSPQNESNNIIQPLPTRLLQKPIVQQSPSTPTSNDLSSDIPTLLPQDGNYIITQVYSTIEFYGHSQVREKELDAFHKHLEDIYNNNGNDQSLSVHFLMEGVPCVIQQGDKYHRVIIKHRESDSRVLVKLIDRGDEIIVDTSELLQLEKKYFTIPAFAQPFRLYNYDESHSTANITRKLKRLILNQRVHITLHSSIINGFYPVEVKLSDNQLVNQILLLNDINPIISSPIQSLDLQNTKLQRINDDLPVPQKLLTAPIIDRSQPGRFTTNSPIINEQTSRFSRSQDESKTINEQNRPYNRDEQQRNGNNRGGRNFNRNNDENDNDNNGQRTTGFNNRGFTDRGGRNDRNFENGIQRTSGYNNRGARNGTYRNNQDEDNNTQRFDNRSGFNGERGNRNSGFQNYRDRDGNGDSGRRGGFNDRGGQRGGRGGFVDRGNRRGGRSGAFGDRVENGFRMNSDNNDSIKTFSGWPNVKSTLNRFESGDNFIENEIPKETFQFVISHIETANDFFIQLYSKGDELCLLSETLQKEYKEAPELNIYTIKLNQPCLAKSLDNCWYRAMILSINTIKIKVRFIDFGDTIDVDKKTIRQLEKKFCLIPPYAYRCTLKNIEINENINTNEIIKKCADKKFDGKIEKKLDDNKYLLQSENFEKLIQTNIKCLIVYIDTDKYQFYIQDDDKIMDKINNEIKNVEDILPDDIKINSMVISTFDDEPYRAIIQSDLNENVNVYFVDYGNTNICSKISLKKCHEQLKSYPYQAKKCQLYDVTYNNLEQIFKELEKYLEYDKTEIFIMNKNDDLFNVLLYIDGECINKKIFEKNDISIDINDQSSSTTATTVQEQERPMSATGKRNNEEILSPIGNSLNTSMNIKRKKSESENEVNSPKYHQGVLTHIDKNKPFIYLQLLPESELNIERINELIDNIIQENKHNSSYDIGDYIIAQFTEDNNYYRARIESYSDIKKTYTVYFLDYGNLDENVPINHLYSYSNELKQIQPQAHGYLLENFTIQIWINKIQSLIENKLNDIIEFYFIDEIQSIIHIKFDNDNQPKTFTANISSTNKDCFYIHILPDINTFICKIDQLLQEHLKEHNTLNSWNINDLCIIFDNKKNQYFRGKILLINNDIYDVQCIDYGNILSNITNDNLYLLTNDYLLKQLPLARQCRLYGVNDKNQIKAIEDIIQYINSNERVTITVENDQNDQCMFVMLFRENNEIVNDRYQQEIDIDKKNTELTNSSDSAIAADDDTSNIQHLTSPIGIPQAESTHQYGDITNVTVSNSSSLTMNQTIDFGENDPSTSNTIIKDDIENDN